MTRLAISLVFFLVVPARAFADERDLAVYLTCMPKSPWLAVAVPGHERSESPEAPPERISIEGLVTYSEEDEKGNVYRTGAKSTEHRCGEFTVRITGGYLNANIQGELGAADDFGLVEVFSNNKRVIGPIAMGECTSTIPRYSHSATCPENWAVVLTVFESIGTSKKGPVAYLKHINEEARGP